MAFWVEIWGQKANFGAKIFKKKIIFRKKFFFEFSDSKSEKGQKNDEKKFSLLKWSDTWSFLAKKWDFQIFKNFQVLKDFDDKGYVNYINWIC